LLFKEKFQVNNFMDMMKHLRGIALMLVTVALVFGSCRDPYILDDQEPEWLGASIYDYLKEHKDANGKNDFTYYVRIIDACNYAEVLGRTGSKTMFVCYDSAFEKYFEQNRQSGKGPKSFEEFTPEQLNQIMEYSMVNEANLIETLSYGVEYVPGQILRRSTSLDAFDLVEKETGAMLPDNSPYFDAYRTSGLYILNDNSSPRLVQFLEAQMAEKGITDEDFSILFNGATRQTGDAHIFDRKVIERDITCKNGYIHVLDALLMPEVNMAQYIRNNGNLSTFNRLMDRFSAPYADASLTTEYKTLHQDELVKDGVLDNGFTVNDSLYVRRYFSRQSGFANLYDPQNLAVPSNEALIFDPNWNSYETAGNANFDMAAMFVPTNKAMEEYFSPDPEARGNFLYKRYEKWDSVPNDIAALFLNAHMKYSFLESLPSRFDGLKNESLDEMFIKKEDVESAKVTTNGAVYMTNKVYPPVELSSVMAPVLVREDTRIFNYPVKSSSGMGFDIYLRSMESLYNPGVVPPYTFIVPLDNAFDNYIYPAAQGYDFPEMLRFEYDSEFQTVRAIRYEYDVNTGAKGAMISPSSEAIYASTELGKIHDVVKVYLSEMMDYHIIVGELKPDQEYYQTKGKGFIRAIYDQATDSYTFYGGGNMEQNQKWSPSKSQTDAAYASKTTESIDFENGTTVFIDKVMQQPLTSVYGKMKNVPQFSAFLETMTKMPDFFIKTSGSGGSQWNAVDFFLSLFTAFHYTVYAPNNEAMQKAYDEGLPTWTLINEQKNNTKKQAMIEKLLNFIKYHIQDNSVYIKGEPQANTRFETALRNPLTGRFYSLYVTQDGENLSIIPAVARLNGLENVPGTSAAGAQNNREIVNVVKTNNQYNLMTRDHIFVGQSLKDVKGSASDWSARAVVHEIDNFLRVIKPPVLSLAISDNNIKAEDNFTFALNTTDTGDGVVFDGSGDKAVITDKGLCYGIGADAGVNDTENVTSFISKSKSDLAEISRTRLAFADMACLSKYFNEDGSRNDVDVAVADSVISVRAYAVSRWADDGTAMEPGKTPLVGYSDAVRINWVNGIKVKDDE